MSAGTVHVVGAGIAGLSAAVRLAESGRKVVLHEAAKAAGGRCRSYRDSTLDLDIDNGNHLLLSANSSALGYAKLTGGAGALTELPSPDFDFADLGTGERWRVRPNRGRLPWWILVPGRRVPGTRASEYLALGKLLAARPGATIGETMRCAGPLWDRLWRPVLLAVMNTEPAESDAGLAAAVIRETLAAGGDASRPVIATGGLSAAFVDPALAWLVARGAEIRLGTRVRELAAEGGAVRTLRTTDGATELGSEDAVVLAVPAWVAGDLLPGIGTPDEFRGIVNGHFRLTPPPGLPPLLGMVGSLSEWLFAYPDRLSVTISAGDRLFDTPREELASAIWREVSAVAGLFGPLPRWQVVKERRATFAATPAQNRKRPEAAGTGLRNLVLAGDWTATGLPATIEGAIRSGEKAAEVLQRGDTGLSRFVSKA